MISETEVKTMRELQPKPPSTEWYERLAIPATWVLVHGSLYGKEVLEIGACTGWISWMARREGACVTATDIFTDGIHESIRSSIEDKERLTFGDMSFDYVLTANVLHHGDLGKTAAEAWRVLKEGGVFVTLQEPCLANAEDERTYLRNHCSTQLAEGCLERRPNLPAYRQAMAVFDRVEFWFMDETIMGATKMTMNEPISDDTKDTMGRPIAIRAWK